MTGHFLLSLLLVFAPIGAPSPADVAAKAAAEKARKAQAEAHVDAILARYSLLEQKSTEKNDLLRQKCSE